LFIEGQAVYVLATKEELEIQFEPWYVAQKDTFQAFDSQGFLLDLIAEDVETVQQLLFLKLSRKRKIVRARKVNPPIENIGYLRSSLINFISYKNRNKLADAELESMALEDLIQESCQYMPWKWMY
jgi:hypothetical protein